MPYWKLPPCLSPENVSYDNMTDLLLYTIIKVFKKHNNIGLVVTSSVAGENINFYCVIKQISSCCVRGYYIFNHFMKVHVGP